MTAKDFIMQQPTRQPEVRIYNDKAPPTPEEDCFGKYPDPAAEECQGCILIRDCNGVVLRKIALNAAKAGIREAEEYEFSPFFLAWYANVLRQMVDGQYLENPETGQLYQIDHTNKKMKLMRGYGYGGFHEASKKVLAHFGYTMEEPPDESQSFAEALVDRLLST